MHFVLNGIFIPNVPFLVLQVSFHIWKGKKKKNYLPPDTLPEMKSKQIVLSPMDSEPWN